MSPVEGITLPGYVSDLGQLFANARFFLNPVFGGTGQQIKVVEAMAHGIPVIALEKIAQNTPIVHGENGFIAKDADEFAHYSIMLWQEFDLRKTLGQAARETIRRSFSQRNLVGMLADLIGR